MRSKNFILFILVLSVFSFGNLNSGLQRGQKILFVRLAAQAGATSPTNMSWIATKFAGAHTVIQSTTIPTDLSSYDQVWDIRWANSNTRTLSDADITKLKNFMKNDSGSVFILGENAGFPNTWTPIRTFVNSVTIEGGFAASGVGFGGNGYSLTIDADACDNAENFDTDFQTGWNKVYTEYPGMVKLSELAGGYPVLKGTGLGKDDRGSNIPGWGGVNQIAAGAIAYTSDKMKPDYSGGKLFLFFDSQAFHCWASTAWGLSNKHKNNLKFFWNAVDFLSKTIPQATLTVTPSSSDSSAYEYTGKSLTLSAETEVSNRIVYRFISGADTSTWDTTASNTGTINISGDGKLEALTIGSKYLNASSSWNYIVKRTAPVVVTSKATNISTTSVVSGGIISSNGGDSITEQGICWSSSSNPDTSSNSIIDTVGDSIFVLPITGLEPDQPYYIRAYAINSEGISYGNEVTFKTSALPLASLISSPGDTTYSVETLDITISTDSSNRIYYTTSGLEPDTTDSTQLLNGGSFSGLVTIKGDAVIKAIAMGNGYQSTSATWNYIQELPKANLEAIVTLAQGEVTFKNNLDTIHIGHEAEVELTSLGLNSADSIRWSFGSDLTGKANWELYSTPIIISDKIEPLQPDTITVTAYANDDNHSSTTKSYVFVRDTVATLTITSSTKFIDNQIVKIELLPSWENQQIFITIDNSIPDSTSTLYNMPFTVNKTTTVSAIAYGDNAVESEIISETYTLATGVDSALYIDSDGNGSIDKAKVKVINNSGTLPDSVLLKNPFDTTDVVVIKADRMILTGDEIVITLEREFYDSINNSTAVLEGFYGAFYGASYSESTFLIKDGVAPLVLSAIYQPGSIEKKDGDIARDDDTLFVTFSESISLPNFSSNKHIFSLKSDDATNYTFDLSLIDYKDNQAAFVVHNINGIAYPHENDEIRINIADSIGDIMNSNMQLFEDNRAALLEVRFVEVEPDIIAFGPVDPKTFEIPSRFQSSITTGVAFLIDYLIVLPANVFDEIDVQITIIDPLGNIITKIKGINQPSENYAINLENSESSRLYVAWNGKNDNGRYISTGSYLALIKYKSSDGKMWNIKKTMIGIKE